jgi:hypothetical protein
MILWTSFPSNPVKDDQRKKCAHVQNHACRQEGMNLRRKTQAHTQLSYASLTVTSNGEVAYVLNSNFEQHNSEQNPHKRILQQKSNTEVATIESTKALRATISSN